jgi:acyl carrier protein phosphodiesterase
MMGNMLGDFIRKDKAGHLEKQIQKGIKLHLEIDHFTDHHPVVQLSKKRLWPIVKHFSPVVTDIFYDHFLAVNWSRFSKISLSDFSAHAYKVLKDHKALFPQRFQQALIYMRFRNLLVSYAKISGMEFALNRVAGRTNHQVNFHEAVKELKRNYHLYEDDFLQFFPELQHFVKGKILC